MDRRTGLVCNLRIWRVNCELSALWVRMGLNEQNVRSGRIGEDRLELGKYRNSVSRNSSMDGDASL